MPASQSDPEADEPPPFLGTWRKVYCAVALYLLALIALLYAVTRHFLFWV